MKKCTSLIVFLLMVMTATAQTQQGYVKTRGRLDEHGNLIPGEGLKGASVFIKNRGSVAVEDDDGAFSFLMTENRFCVDSVRKTGYQLVDMDFCGRYRDYSDTPVDILMEKPGQSVEDYMEDLKIINASQQAMINKLRNEVKDLKKKGEISEEEFKRQLSELAKKQSQSQSLVTEMAERYSKMDFDRLDAFNRQIGWLILNGELIKADSLIHSKGSMKSRSLKLDSIHLANAEVEIILDQSKKYEQEEFNAFVSDCRSLSEISLLNHAFDSAAYWLELRTSKDSSNVQWQIETGSLFFIVPNYEKALCYFELAKRQASSQFGEQSDMVAIVLSRIGLVYYKLGDYKKALEYLNDALAILETIYGQSHIELAKIYNGMSAVYLAQGVYNKAIEYGNLALDIRKSVYGNNDLEVASSYNNVGVIFHMWEIMEKQ